MRIAMVLAAVMIWPAAAIAQGDPSKPEEDSIIVPERRISPPAPNPEALALGRRLAAALHQQAISQRIGEIVARAEEGMDPPREPPPPPEGPIRAISPVLPPRDWSWGVEMQERAVEHVARVYARRYSVEELRRLAAFFESPIGRKYLDERDQVTTEVREALRSPRLDEELWEVVCGPRAPADPVDGPNHAYVRIPPARSDAPPRPLVCVSPIPAGPQR